MVVFADTSLCTTCYIKQMPNWYNLIDSVKRGYGDSVEFCFIINVQKQKLDEILKTFEQVNFDYPCFWIHHAYLEEQIRVSLITICFILFIR